MPRIFPKKEFLSQSILARNLSIKVINHAVSNEETFLKVLKNKKIEIPIRITNIKKKTPKMEELLSLNNCIYFSAGFDYNATFHHWPFGFLFKLDILRDRNFKVFKTYLISQSWMIFLNYLKEKDPNTLIKLNNLNKRTKRDISLFFRKGSCSFWEIEKELFDSLNNHRDKVKILKIIKNYKIKMQVSNFCAPKYIGKHYLDSDETRRIEIISTKPISLNEKEFLGVYIEKSKIKKMLPKIRKYLDKNKIVFDGSKVL